MLSLVSILHKEKQLVQPLAVGVEERKSHEKPEQGQILSEKSLHYPMYRKPPQAKLIRHLHLTGKRRTFVQLTIHTNIGVDKSPLRPLYTIFLASIIDMRESIDP